MPESSLESKTPYHGAITPTTPRGTHCFIPIGADPHRFLIFSGGTAFNKYASFLADITPHITYCLPVSDNGGSSAEIMRILGGPAIGDIRSRLLRLSSQHLATVTLLQHRLPQNLQQAKAEWLEIVEGTHVLWVALDNDDKQLIRMFLVHFNTTIMCPVVRQGCEFRFSGGSIGNFFFTGARLFFHSLSAAIRLW